MAHYALELERDGYRADHVQWAVKHRVCCRRAGLGQAFGGKNLEDLDRENRKIPTECLATFLEGLRQTVAPHHGPEQLGHFIDFYFHSMSHKCHAFKLLSAMSRNAPMEAHVWTKHPEAARRELGKVLEESGLNEDQAREIFAALQSYTVEVLNGANLPGKRDNGNYRIARTECETAFKLSGIGHGTATEDRTRRMCRSALDCASMGMAVSFHGTRLEVLEVPPHRIFGGFFLNPAGNGPLGGASCHGITFQPEGLAFSYPGNLLAPWDSSPKKFEGPNPELALASPTGDPAARESEEMDFTLARTFHLIPVWQRSTKKPGEFRKCYISQEESPDLFDRYVEACREKGVEI
jgi:hypothetical protein